MTYTQNLMKDSEDDRGRQAQCNIHDHS